MCVNVFFFFLPSNMKKDSVRFTHTHTHISMYTCDIKYRLGTVQIRLRGMEAYFVPWNICHRVHISTRCILCITVYLCETETMSVQVCETAAAAVPV